jgi:hypothetical protein
MKVSVIPFVFFFLFITGCASTSNNEYRQLPPNSSHKQSAIKQNDLTAEVSCKQGDCQNGFGVKKYPSGDLYYGDFQNGFRHGQGTYMFNTGGKYRGVWIKGLLNGECENDSSFSGWNKGYCTMNEKQQLSFVSNDTKRKKEYKNKATEINKIIQSL